MKENEAIRLTDEAYRLLNDMTPYLYDLYDVPEGERAFETAKQMVDTLTDNLISLKVFLRKRLPEKKGQ